MENKNDLISEEEITSVFESREFKLMQYSFCIIFALFLAVSKKLKEDDLSE